MIRIFTSPDGARHYLVPAVVRDVAKALFPGEDEVGAIFRLARGLLTDHLASVEQIALNVGHDAAVKFARERIVVRWPRA